MTMMFMVIVALIAMAIFISEANAAPFLESDPYPAASTPKPTICQVWLDTATVGVDSPVVVDATGTYCHYDIAAVTVGAHTVKAKFITIDPVWGRLESALTAPINFTRPGPPQAPAGLILAPN